MKRGQVEDEVSLGVLEQHLKIQFIVESTINGTVTFGSTYKSGICARSRGFAIFQYSKSPLTTHTHTHTHPHTHPALKIALLRMECASARSSRSWSLRRRAWDSTGTSQGTRLILAALEKSYNKSSFKRLLIIVGATAGS